MAAVFVTEPTLAQYTPQTLNISGGLYQPNGLPVTNASVNFRIEIWDKNATCKLYEETHLAQNLSQTKGGFSLQLGEGSSITNYRDAGNPGSLSWLVFANPGAPATVFAGCGGGVIFAAGDNRMIRVYYDIGSGMTAMTPDVPIESSAYAMVANTLEGKRADEFIQVRDDVGTDLNQANVETVFSATNYAKLLQLLNNTFAGSYGFNNQRITDVAAPTAGTDAVNRTWVDGHVGDKAADLTGVGSGVNNGHTLIWDAGNNRWTTGVPSAVDNSKLPLAGGTMSGPITMGGFDLYNTGHITMGNQRMLTLGRYTSVQEGLLGLGAGDEGRMFYNTDLDVVRVWDGTGYIGFGASGAAGGDLTGSYPNPTIAVGAVTTTKIGTDAVQSSHIDNAGIGINRLVVSDGVTGNTLRFKTCSTGEILQWGGTGWACVTVPTAMGASGVTAGVYGSATTVSRIGVNAQGVVTSAVDVAINFPVVSVNGKTGVVVLNGADLGLGTASLEDVGNGANEIPMTDGAGKLNPSVIPTLGIGDISGAITQIVAGSGLTGGGTQGVVTLAVDLTQVDAYKIRGRDVAATAPAGSDVLMWNASTSVWEPQTIPSAPVYTFTGTNGALVSGTAFNKTISIDTGVTTGQIVQIAAGDRLPVIDGSNLTQISNIRNVNVSTAVPTLNQVLQYNGSAWEAATLTDNAGVTYVATTSDLTGGPISATGTLGVNTGTGANQILKLNGSSQIPAVDGSLLTNVNAYSIRGVNVSTTAPTLNQVLQYNGSGWEAATLTDNAGVTMVTAGTGLLGGVINSTGTISVDVGTGANQIVQLDGSSRLPAVNGSQLTNVNAVQIQARDIASAAPADNQVLTWNNSASRWEPRTPGAGADNLGSHIAAQNVQLNGFWLSGDGGNEGVFVAGAGNVGVGTNTPNVNAILDINGLASMSALLVPRDSTGNRPTGVAGMIRYNTTTAKMEVYENGGWADVVQTPDGGILTITGENGALVSGSATVKTISIDTGVTTGQIVQVAAGNRLPVIDGSNLTQISNLRNVNVSTAAPTLNQVLQYNGSAWEAASLPAANDVAAGTAILLSGPATMRTISVDVGIGANQIPQLNGSGYLGIGTASVTAGAVADFYGATNLDSAVVLPRATTANRPGGVNGMIRYNTSLAKFEVYENGNWYSMATGSTGDNLGNHIATQAIQLNGQWLSNDGGAEGIRIDNSGNVGIGTSNPIDRLSVDSGFIRTDGAAAYGFRLFRNGSVVGSLMTSNSRVSINDEAGNGIQFLNSSASPNLTILNGGNVGIGTSNPSQKLSIDSGSLIIAGTAAYGVLLSRDGTTIGGITTANSKVSIKDEAGNGIQFLNPSALLSMIIVNDAVGIGTTLPNTGAILDLYGTGNLSAMIVPRATTAERPVTAANGMIRYNTNLAKFEVYEAGTWTSIATGNPTSSQWTTIAGNELIYNSAAFVGVGAGLDPTAEFHVADTGSTTARLRISNSTTGHTTADGLEAGVFNNDAWLYNMEGGALDLGTSGLTRVSIRPNGNVGIGTTTATDRLYIKGGDGDQLTLDNDGSWHSTLTFSNSGATRGRLEYNDSDSSFNLSTNANGRFLKFSTGNNIEAARITADGRIGVGTTSPNANSVLDINGTGNISSILIPRDTTANRPTGVNGMIRYNTNTARFEAYEGGGWVNMTAVGAGTGDLLNGGNTGAVTVGSNNSSVAIEAGGTSYLTIDASGNVDFDSSSAGMSLGYAGFTRVFISNNIEFAPHASNYMYMDSGLGFGLFETSPEARLEISANNSTSGNMLMLSSNDGADGNLLIVKENGRAAFGNNSPTSGAILELNGTGTLSSLLIPRDTTANRPTGINGMIRYNTNLAAFEVYANNNWATVATGAGGSSQWTTTGSDIYYNTGNVAIGTTAMSNNLTVVGMSGISQYATTLGQDIGGQVFLGGRFNGTAGAYRDFGAIFGAKENGTNGNDAGYFGIFTRPNGGSLTERMRVTSTGYVGIGTTTPTYALDARGTGNNVFRVQHSSKGDLFRVRDDAGGSGDSIIDLNADHVHLNQAVGDWNNILFYAKSTADSYNTMVLEGRSSQTADIFDIRRNGSTTGDILSVTAAGRIGLGSATPTSGSILDVRGTGTGFSSLIVPRDSTANRPTGVNGMIRYNTTSQKFEVYEGTWQNMISAGGGSSQWTTVAGNEIHYSTANVGIGTSDPQARLHVYGGNIRLEDSTYLVDGGNQELIGGASSGNVARIASGTFNNWSIGNSDTSQNGRIETSGSYGNLAMRFSTNGGERMRIHTNGNVGIGTTVPNSKLHVHDDFAQFTYGAFGTGSNDGFFVGLTQYADAHLWNKEAGGMEFGTNDQLRMIIDQNGNVGIGTSNPVYSSSNTKLDLFMTDASGVLTVENASSTSNRFPSVTVRNNMGTTNFGGYPLFGMVNGRGSYGSQTALSSGDYLGQLLFTGYDGSTDSWSWGSGVTSSTTQAWTTSAHGSNLQFLTTPNGTNASVVRMIIDQNGNVGIGTTDPTTKLMIRNIDTRTGLDYYATNDTNVEVAPSSATSAYAYYANFNRLYTSSSNLGTADFYGMDNSVHTYGGTGTIQNVWGSSSNFSSYAGRTTANAIGAQGYIFNDHASSVITNAMGVNAFVTNTSGTISNAYGVYIGSIAGTNRFSLYAEDAGARSYFAGAVGIGTDGPNVKLDVYDSVASDVVAQVFNTNTGTSADVLQLRVNRATPATGNTFIDFANSAGTTVGSITGDGAGGVQYNLTSDRRLKGNIRDTHYSIEDLMKIRVRDYHYLGHGVDTNGFIAQELYEAYPPAVSKPEDESKQWWQVDYGRLSPLLVKGIQDIYGLCKMTEAQTKALEARVAAHDAEIESLKREVQSLRERNQELEQKLDKVLRHLNLE